MSTTNNALAQETPQAAVENTELNTTTEQGSLENKTPAPAIENKTETTPPPAKTVVPEKYDLKLPEKSLLNSEHLEKISAFAKAKGFSQEQAQELLERESSAVTDFESVQRKNYESTRAAWVETAKSDKELGGDAFNKNVEMAKRVIARFGTEEFKKELDSSGLGDHPELLRFVSRVGKAMSEDQLVLPGANAGGGKKTIEDIFYGETKT